MLGLFKIQIQNIYPFYTICFIVIFPMLTIYHFIYAAGRYWNNYLSSHSN